MHDAAALLKQIKKFSLPIGTCLHVDACGTRCSNKPIQSHSIQKGRLLKAIAENGHVKGFSPPNSPKSGGMTFKDFGVSKASTFPGYCKKHDAMIFKDIETGKVNLDERSICLFSLRVVGREVFTKNAQMRLNNHPEVRNLLNRNYGRDFYDQMMVGISLAKRELENYKLRIERMINTNTYADIIYVAKALKEPLPFCVAGSFPPEHTLDGSVIAPNDLQEWGICFAICGSTGSDHFWIMSALESSKVSHVRPFVESIINHPGDPGDLMLNVSLEYIENIFFRPSWVEAQSDFFKVSMLSKMESGLPSKHRHRAEDLLTFDGVLSTRVVASQIKL